MNGSFYKPSDWIRCLLATVSKVVAICVRISTPLHCFLSAELGSAAGLNCVSFDKFDSLKVNPGFGAPAFFQQSPFSKLIFPKFISLPNFAELSLTSQSFPKANPGIARVPCQKARILSTTACHLPVTYGQEENHLKNYHPSDHFQLICMFCFNDGRLWPQPKAAHPCRRDLITHVTKSKLHSGLDPKCLPFIKPWNDLLDNPLRVDGNPLNGPQREILDKIRRLSGLAVAVVEAPFTPAQTTSPSSLSASTTASLAAVDTTSLELDANRPPVNDCVPFATAFAKESEIGQWLSSPAVWVSLCNFPVENRLALSSTHVQGLPRVSTDTSLTARQHFSNLFVRLTQICRESQGTAVNTFRSTYGLIDSEGNILVTLTDYAKIAFGLRLCRLVSMRYSAPIPRWDAGALFQVRSATRRKPDAAS